MIDLETQNAELIEQINSLQAARGRLVDEHFEEKKALREQLAKANERVEISEKEIERLAQVNAELIIKNNELKQDKERLDLLDKCNSDFNERCGSNYGWRVDWNHNRIALVDTGIPKIDVRAAIDRFKARLSMQLRNEQGE